MPNPILDLGRVSLAAAMWSVHNPDGRREGPLAIEDLIHKLRAGGISSQAWVRRHDERDFRPLKSYEALSDLCPKPPDTTLVRVRLRFALACGAVVFAFFVGLLF